MDKRFVTFLAATFIVLSANMLFMRWRNADQQKAKIDLAEVQAEADKAEREKAAADKENPETAASDNNNADKPAGDEKPIDPAIAGVQPEKAAGEQPAAAEPAAPRPEVAEQRYTLGSADPKSDYRLLVYFTNAGAAVERIELNSPNYLDQEDRSGSIGQLDLALPPSQTTGALVRVVGPGTPAQTAGVHVGDVITSFNGEEISDEIDFERKLEQTEPGDEFELAVNRDGKAVALSGTLVRRPMQVIRPEVRADGGIDPLSFLLTLNSIDDKRIADDEEELPGVKMRTSNWQALPQADPDELVFQYELPEYQLTVLKRFRLAKVDPADAENPTAPAYHLSFAIEVQNSGSNPHKVAWRLEGPTGLPLEGAWYATKISPRWFRSAGMRDVVVGFFRNNQTKYGLISASSIADDKDIVPWQEDAKDQLVFLGVDAQYFAAALLPGREDAKDISYSSAVPMRVGPVPPDRNKLNRTNVSFQLISKTEVVPPQGKPFGQSFEIFAGPKKPSLLAEYGLGKLLYHGWFGFVAEPMSIVLHFFHRIIPNYGIAIIMLTVLVRSLMYPISRRQALSSQKMQELQPELKRIQEKFKNNMEARSKAMQELYKKHNFNPLAGCLPVFLQLPIFMGLYRSLAVDVELRGAPLISESVRWCSNLAAPDMLWHWENSMPAFIAGPSGFLGPYFNLLPCITAGLFIWQQRMFMPPPADEQAAMQQKVMQYMTVMIGLMFFKVPSGLCVYFIASSLWGICERKLLPKTRPANSANAPAARPVVVRANPNGNGSPSTKKKNRGRT